jgi:hypothetical protein
MQQHKLEIKGKTFHKRLHHSEDGGNSYDMLLRVNINRVWKDDKTWFGQYAATYASLL